MDTKISCKRAEIEPNYAESKVCVTLYGMDETEIEYIIEDSEICEDKISEAIQEHEEDKTIEECLENLNDMDILEHVDDDAIEKYYLENIKSDDKPKTFPSPELVK